jgi:hypothetical protein
VQIVVLIFDAPKTQEWLSRIVDSLGSWHIALETRLVLTNGASRLFFIWDRFVEEEYEPDELKTIKSVFPKPFFLTVDYNDRNLLLEVVRKLASECHFLIDNDMGWIAPVSDVLDVAHHHDWLTYKPS